MSDDTVRLSMVGRVVRTRWRLLAVIAAAGALAGVGASVLLSPGYETSTTVLLQGPREPDELRTATQVAISMTVLDRAAARLDWNVTGPDLQDSVSAEVLDGNVIKIIGTAETPGQAKQLTDRVAEEYVRFATQLVSNTADASAQVLQEQRETLRRQVADTNDVITKLHASVAEGVTVDSVAARTQLESLRSSLDQAVTKLDEAEATSSKSNTIVMGPADLPTGPAAPTMVHFVVGGTLLFFLLGVLGHLVANRADRRLRGEGDIASALNTTIVGSVDVPHDPPAATTPWRKLRYLVVPDDRPWDLADRPVTDELARDVRYRRALDRLRPGARVLALVADDDPTARRAAEALAARSADAAQVRVVEVFARQPTVGDGADGVLVVLTAGTRTPWELVGIVEACADAGHEVIGAFVAHPVQPTGDRPDAPEAAVRDEAMAGST